MKTKITMLVTLLIISITSIYAQISLPKKNNTNVQVYKIKKPIQKKTNNTVKKTNERIKATLVAPNGKHYFFTKNRYFRLSEDNGLEKVANTKPNWVGIPDNVDAAFVNSKNKKAYFFKGSKYNRWDFKNGNDNPELAISRFWKGVPSNIDAVTEHPNGKIYFFKEDKYYRYVNGKVDKVELISKNWRGVPNNVAAALLHKNGKIYFFKGNKYYRFNVKSNKVDKVATIGRDGWKELDFNKKNFIKKPPKKIKLKITLTAIEVIKSDRNYDFVDVLLQQTINYKANGRYISDIKSQRKFQKFKTDTHLKNDSQSINVAIIYPDWENFRLITAGDKNFINNSLVYALNSKEVADDNALIEIRTNLSGYYLKNGKVKGHNYKIAENLPINVKINEILKYLLNPNGISLNYFNSDGYHYSGAEGTVMPFKIAALDKRAIDGYIESYNLGITIRTYFHFELVQ